MFGIRLHSKNPITSPYWALVSPECSLPPASVTLYTGYLSYDTLPLAVRLKDAIVRLAVGKWKYWLYHYGCKLDFVTYWCSHNLWVRGMVWPAYGKWYRFSFNRVPWYRKIGRRLR